MTESTENQGVEVPRSLWIVGLISLLWNLYGAYDYTMSKTGGDAYLKSVGMTDAQIAYFHAMPTWMTIPWALGVWGAVAGSLLLLLRSRWAPTAFLVSLGGLVVSLVYNYALSDGLAVNGQQSLIMYGVILAGCLVFLWFANRMAKAGVLR